MKTITLNTYQFNELPENIQEKVIQNFRDSNCEDCFFTDDATKTLDKFCDIFNITWIQFDFQEMYRSEYKFNLEDNILEMTGLRLAKYIYNNFYDQITQGQYFGRLSDFDKHGNRIPVSDKHKIGKRHVIRHSKVLIDNSCPLTGMCYDDDILQPIFDFLKKPSDRIDFETLLEDCLHSLAHAVSSEIDYQNSDEAIIENIESNGYEFYDNGTIV